MGPLGAGGGRKRRWPPAAGWERTETASKSTVLSCRAQPQALCCQGSKLGAPGGPHSTRLVQCGCISFWGADTWHELGTCAAQWGAGSTVTAKPVPRCWSLAASTHPPGAAGTSTLLEPTEGTLSSHWGQAGALAHGALTNPSATHPRPPPAQAGHRREGRSWHEAAVEPRAPSQQQFGAGCSSSSTFPLSSSAGSWLGPAAAASTAGGGKTRPPPGCPGLLLRCGG